jgi:hypothetical protein
LGTSHPNQVDYTYIKSQLQIHKYEGARIISVSSGPDQGSFFRLHVARKHQKEFSSYKRYKNSRIFLDEKAKCQPWIIKKGPKIG